MKELIIKFFYTCVSNVINITILDKYICIENNEMNPKNLLIAVLAVIAIIILGGCIGEKEPEPSPTYEEPILSEPFELESDESELVEPELDESELAFEEPVVGEPFIVDPVEPGLRG